MLVHELWALLTIPSCLRWKGCGTIARRVQAGSALLLLASAPSALVAILLALAWILLSLRHTLAPAGSELTLVAHSIRQCEPALLASCNCCECRIGLEKVYVASAPGPMPIAHHGDRCNAAESVENGTHVCLRAIGGNVRHEDALARNASFADVLVAAGKALLLTGVVLTGGSCENDLFAVSRVRATEQGCYLSILVGHVTATAAAASAATATAELTAPLVDGWRTFGGLNSR